MEPSIDLMVGVWGVLFAGAAYLPLSPEYPPDRLRYMLTDSRTRIVLTTEDLKPRLEKLVPEGTVIVTGSQVSAVPPAPEPATRTRGTRGTDLAYVIYTSGSTGRPKGIMVEHRSIVSQMRWLGAHQGLSEISAVLQKTPMSFDAAQWEILAPALGSRVVMSEPGAYRDPERLIDTIVANQVTTLQAVPTLLQALVDTGLSACTSLTQVFSGGEALSKNLAGEVLEQLPGCELVNLYGPSECTINASAYRVDPETLLDGPDIVPIGYPVRNTELYVLDAERNPVAAGQTGELYISGIQLARGYLHRPDLTAERFVTNPHSTGPGFDRMYRTGDLARWNPDGTVQFVGRTDSQVKLRGFRVELDEIRVAIEQHTWVKRAAVIVRDDPRTGANLIAVTELNANEAALMDQGNHGAHHQSKHSKIQIRAQLSNPGCRDDADLAGRPRIELPGRVPTARQRKEVFARKTYRFFEGGDTTRADLLALLASGPAGGRPGRVEALTPSELGRLLRYFGQFQSEERLLPKYGYASPGSLYATQLYLELAGVAGYAPGYYYYHPISHQLVLIRPGEETGQPRLRIHLIGRKSAIEPVYRNNIQEVLQIETGHLAGLFDAVLPEHGLQLADRSCEPVVKELLDCADEDYYLGTFAVQPWAEPGSRRSLSAEPVQPGEPVEIYVQAHPGRIADLPMGQYHYTGGELRPISAELVLKRHVIAINQQVYERAGFGITLLSRDPDPWNRYVELGRRLHRLQSNDLGLGLMSSGYSSETGNDLPSARRFVEILGAQDHFASYFAVGGRISPAQRQREDMHEDVVHMKGPAEMIRDDLAERLPHYMVPNRVTVLDALPLTANGKVDLQAVRELDAVTAEQDQAPLVAPRTVTEQEIAVRWQRALRRPTVSVHEDFFAVGGNSLIAVGLISRINRELGSSLPLQAVFESPTVEALARRVERDAGREANGSSSRLVPLRAEGDEQPIFCWPGLGGYPMNLRLLAAEAPAGRPFFGVQAFGINPAEVPFPTIAEMAARDVELLRSRQPVGPYRLWGYSFGANVAFEVAHQLEQAGEQVEELFLIAPGRPIVDPPRGAAAQVPAARTGADPGFGDPAFVSILFSVFAGSLHHPALDECLVRARDEASFIAFVCEQFDYLDADLVSRIVAVIQRTFQFEYTPAELDRRRIEAPVTVFRATGDEDCFIERGQGHLVQLPRIVHLRSDHYSLLRDSGIGELSAAIRAEREQHDLHHDQEEFTMPHVSIKHFPRTLDPDETTSLVAAITSAVQAAFSCDESVVSIALEPITQDTWNEKVYVPEIVNAKGSLVKVPNY